MKRNLHPYIYVLRKEISEKKIHYDQISAETGISLNRLKNLLSGRGEMYLSEADTLFGWLRVSHVEALLRRYDVKRKNDLLDLSRLSPVRKQLVTSLYQELLKT